MNERQATISLPDGTKATLILSAPAGAAPQEAPPARDAGALEYDSWRDAGAIEYDSWRNAP